MVIDRDEEHPDVGDDVDDENELEEEGEDAEHASQIKSLLYHVGVVVDAVAELLVLQCFLLFVVEEHIDDHLVVLLIASNDLNKVPYLQRLKYPQAAEYGIVYHKHTVRNQYKQVKSKLALKITA